MNGEVSLGIDCIFKDLLWPKLLFFLTWKNRNYNCHTLIFSLYCHAECFLSFLTHTHSLTSFQHFSSSRRFQKKGKGKNCCTFLLVVAATFVLSFMDDSQVVSSNELWVIVDGFVQIDFYFLFFCALRKHVGWEFL